VQQTGHRQPVQDLAPSAPQRARKSEGAAGERRRARALGYHLLLLACYLAAGIGLTWPRFTFLTDGRIQATRDGGSYTWGFWWVARQVEHLASPWFSSYLAAPVGSQLGYHALMPLEGVIMMPVTLLFGPAASYNLLCILMPGLMCYAMYRAARLWLTSELGAIAAGGLFGLSSMLTWHDWYQLNLAAGVLFLPIALEASIRLRRNPGWKQAVILGLVLAGSLLTDQESAVMVLILAAAALAPWLLRRPRAGQPGQPGWARKLTVTATAIGVMLVVASPQIIAMIAQTRSGGAAVPQHMVNSDYLHSGTSLPSLFSASPMLARHGLSWLRPITYQGPIRDGVPTFGLALTVLAVLGLIVARRRRSARLLFAFWVLVAALTLGIQLRIGSATYTPLAAEWKGVRLSLLMPFSWFVHLPGMSGFREAARLTMLAIVPACLLAGAAVEWLSRHALWALAPLLILAALETGWSGNPGVGTMPDALPALDRPIAADHSSSIVVDVPFGIRGGVPLKGEGAAYDPEAQVLQTADGHPRAIGYLSRLPEGTLAAIHRHAFYDGLFLAEHQLSLGAAEQETGTSSYRSLLAAARLDARRMNVGWVLVWHRMPVVVSYLRATGFRFDYRADGVTVYRPGA